MTVPAEFQVVIMAAGKGSRMTELTSGKPKCLLPVGNKPLVWYPLYKVQQSGFTDVILVVLESEKAQIEEALEKTDLDLKIDYCIVEDDEDMGTADSLRELHEKIKSDVIVMSADFITDASLKGIVDLFRKHNASIASLLFHPQKQESVAVPGPKLKHKKERDLLGIDSETSRLIFQASVSDFEESVPSLHTLLTKHRNLKMYTNLVDAHLYVLKKWVIEYVGSKENISSVKGELLPHIIKRQMKRQPTPVITNGSVIARNDSEDIFEFAKEDPLNLQVREMSSFNDHYGDMSPVYHDNAIRCYAFVARPKDFGVRINTLLSYWSINKQISERWEKITGGKEFVHRSPNAVVNSTQIDDKCIVWDGGKLNEKTSFKDSIIGNNTEVHSFSRVFNSIVMNNVVIKEKVAVENCIICDGVTIEKGCQLKNCIVGFQHIVPEQSTHSNEVLTESDRFMEL